MDMALGIVDSTEIYIAVPSHCNTPSGGAYWVEIESKPAGAGVEDSELFRLLVSEAITRASPQDSLVDYVLEFYIKKGSDSIKAEEPARLRDFPLGPNADSEWALVPGVTVSTPAGDFSCEEKSRSIVHEKEIPTGRVKLVEKRNDRWTVWFSQGVPIFHLVRCSIERSKETETVPAIPGIPSSGKRESQTVAELVGFGYDAEPIISVDP
ncbi:MAG: hypothetical protein GTO42_10580 [Candidatus Latescibacteria bacterium]|nr:hypothetical protein [Candidatus Latescibacterota bacterium]NIO29487.1 hypothetical protein [Candidatus Latescibacterota bacterium]NIT03061.1 hypothetical protein [Candidatus Latescibacterota bacterium]